MVKLNAKESSVCARAVMYQRLLREEPARLSQMLAGVRPFARRIATALATGDDDGLSLDELEAVNIYRKWAKPDERTLRLLRNRQMRRSD